VAAQVCVAGLRVYLQTHRHGAQQPAHGSLVVQPVASAYLGRLETHRSARLYFVRPTWYNRFMNTTLDVLEITDMIHAGTFDADLTELSTAVNMRLQDLGVLPKSAPVTAPASFVTKPVSKGKLTIDDLEVGDKVRFNSQCGTKYMIGQVGTVKSKRRTKVVVLMDTPVGRFARTDSSGKVYSAPVVVPMSILEKL